MTRDYSIMVSCANLALGRARIAQRSGDYLFVGVLASLRAEERNSHEVIVPAEVPGDRGVG